MTLIAETGHYSNISNFEKAIAICSNFRDDFAPCNPQIKIINMMHKWHEVVLAETNLQNIRDENRQLVNKRENIFKSLGKRITMILGIVESLNESAAFKKEVKILANKIRGFKMAGSYIGNESFHSNYSKAPQLSFVHRTENFQHLINMLSASPIYLPNEENFKVGSLQNEQQHMHFINEKIADSNAAIADARRNRDHLLYDEMEGLLCMMRACKSYVKGVYGASSEEYRLLSGLKFRSKPL